MSERKESCETCRFWRGGVADDPAEAEVRRCHRYPPVQNVLRAVKIALNVRDYQREHDIEENRYPFDENTFTPYDDVGDFDLSEVPSIHPETWSYDWCGEWRPKDTTTDDPS